MTVRGLKTVKHYTHTSKAMVQRPDLKSEKNRLMSEDHSERTEGRHEGQRVVSLSLSRPPSIYLSDVSSAV